MIQNLKKSWLQPLFKESFWREFQLEFITFYTGFSVLVFEITGARLLAPFVGTSLYVWTSIIGVILISLAIGYGIGGWWADRTASRKKISGLIFAASIAMLIAFWMSDIFSLYILGFQWDLRITALILALVLFSPSSIFLGMVPPHVVKLALKDVNLTGQVVGRLDALSTLGSITGAFLSGFFLLPRFGTNWIMIFLIVTLFLLSLIAAPANQKRLKVSYVALLVSAVLLNNVYSGAREANNYIDTDTKYSRVQIYPDRYRGRDILRMQINSNFSSAMFIDDPNELVYNYTRYYDLYEAWGIEPNHTLMLGGAAYSYPKYFLESENTAEIDVVEIDSKLTELAMEYFGLSKSPRLGIYHQDARVLTNQWANTREGFYDVVFGDAFKARYEIPYSLTTVEFAEHVYNMLNADGVYLINVIGSVVGPNSQFTQVMVTTLREVFPQVELFMTLENPQEIQNIMIVAAKNPQEPSVAKENTQLIEILDKRYLGSIPDSDFILTDTYAPVEELSGAYSN